MKLKKIFIISLIFTILLFSIGAISAEDNSDLSDITTRNEINEISELNEINEISELNEGNEITNEKNGISDLIQDQSDLDNSNPIESDELQTKAEEIETIELESNAEDIEKDTITNKDSSGIKVLTDSATNIKHIYVDTSNPNQVLNPTVQPFLDAASDGDTIMFHGMFMHCHFEINKTLHLIAAPGTSLGPCPHHQFPAYSGMYGIFHISEAGSGTTIEGFEFLNNNYSIAYNTYNPFAIYVDGASDIELKNLTINWTGWVVEGSGYDPQDFIYEPILIRNANNVSIHDNIINNTINGITIDNSSNISISDNIISGGKNSGIHIGEDVSEVYIGRNNITENQIGIEAYSADNLSVINNLIKNNGKSGIYLNTNISKFDVKGNYFISNGANAILYDYQCYNLNGDKGAESLTAIDNNIFTGHTGMIVHHTIYVPDEKYGDYVYNSENDTYTYVGISNGTYSQDKGYNYLNHSYVINDIVCGHSFYTSTIPWDVNAPNNNGAYNLSLSLELSQNSKGVYNLSIVDSNGNPALDFNNFYAVFYLNDYNETVDPQGGEIYKKVLIENGSAIADFRELKDSFINGSNKITAVLEGINELAALSPNKELLVNESENPNNEAEPEPVVVKDSPKLTTYKLTTFPLSDAYFKVKLSTSEGKALASKTVKITINKKTYTVKTDKTGIAKVKVNLITKKTYSVAVKFAGDSNYKSISKTGTIVVKAGSKKAKITSSNLKVKKNTKKTYSFKLLTSANKAIKSAKVHVILNGKTYTVKTNTKGVAKLSFKLSTVKKYAITMKFLGNSNYKAVSKKSTITVTK